LSITVRDPASSTGGDAGLAANNSALVHASAASARDCLGWGIIGAPQPGNAAWGRILSKIFGVGFVPVQKIFTLLKGTESRTMHRLCRTPQWPRGVGESARQRFVSLPSAVLPDNAFTRENIYGREDKW